MSERCMVQEKNIDLIVGNGNQQDNNEPLYKNRFVIPNYQRGYRWTKSEVTQLLDDISMAMSSGMQKYCLQPIVLLKDSERKANEREQEFYFGEQRPYIVKSWKVIDGQQRLTTIFLILYYLSKTDETADCYQLEYETRHQTNDCLNAWVDAVIDYSPRKQQFPQIVSNNSASLDIYYLRMALKTINDWFEKNSTSVTKKDFNSFLRKSVICLWYEFALPNADDNADITLFSRINMGKIPLTASELLKALLLRKRAVKRDTTQDDDILLYSQKKLNEEQRRKLAEEQQYQRAVQWDQMEQALSEDGFFRFICSEKVPLETRMDYLFNLEYLYITEDNAAPEKEDVFRFFEKQILNSREESESDRLWEQITYHFSLLQEWYRDRIAFHKIGFIVATATKNKQSVIIVRDLIREYEACPDKTTFVENKLDTYIRQIVQDKLKTNEISEITYDSNYEVVRTILLLFNVITAMKSPDYRFAFENVYPLKENCSVEHIFPQTPRIEEIVENYRKQSKSRSDAEAQQRCAVDAFVVSVKAELQMVGKKAPENDPTDDNASLELWWSEVLKELGIDNTSVQAIGNLALISKNLNTKLTNGMFFAKQRQIKELDKAGEFIPICTHNAFLKYYSIGEGKTTGVFWEKADMECHRICMVEMLSDYLPIIPRKEGVTNG